MYTCACGVVCAYGCSAFEVCVKCVRRCVCTCAVCVCVCVCACVKCVSHVCCFIHIHTHVHVYVLYINCFVYVVTFS